MGETSDLQDRFDVSEAKNRLINWVAISVATISVFMSISKVKTGQAGLMGVPLHPTALVTLLS
jgi:hypothetical protein